MADKVIQVTITLPEDSTVERAERIAESIENFIVDNSDIPHDKVSWYVEMLKDQDTS